MSRKRIDLLLPLLVVVIAGGAVALVVGLTGTSAEPGPPTPFEQEVTNPPAPSPQDVPTRVVKWEDQKGFGSWGKTEPKLPLNELPPMPPPFGTGRRVNPDGSITTSDDPISPELQAKIDEMKRQRRALFGATSGEE